MPHEANRVFAASSHKDPLPKFPRVYTGANGTLAREGATEIIQGGEAGERWLSTCPTPPENSTVKPTLLCYPPSGGDPAPKPGDAFSSAGGY